MTTVLGIIGIVSGVGQMVTGLAGDVGGGALCASGVGIPVGVAVVAGSTTLVVAGAAEVAASASLVYSSVSNLGGDVDELKKAKEKEETKDSSGHMLGENGTQTNSTTTGRNVKKERVDVENPAPGESEGNVHYHEPDNTKWKYDVDLKKLVYRKTKELAPPRVQKVLKEEWFQKALKKALKILGE